MYLVRTYRVIEKTLEHDRDCDLEFSGRDKQRVLKFQYKDLYNFFLLTLLTRLIRLVVA